MAKFLIEVPHEAKPVDCALAIRIFLTSGSHFLSNADWGCMDGLHKAWMTVDADNKEAARNILPPAYRSIAHIVGLNSFTLEQANEILKKHQAE